MSDPEVLDKVEDINLDQEDIVDPWTVTSKSDTGIDYDKLISKTLNFLIYFITKIVSLQRSLVVQKSMKPP